MTDAVGWERTLLALIQHHRVEAAVVLPLTPPRSLLLHAPSSSLIYYCPPQISYIEDSHIEAQILDLLSVCVWWLSPWKSHQTVPELPSLQLLDSA